MKVLFVNENIGGHSTVHLNLERALREHDEIQARFLHMPPPGLVRRIAGTRLPVLGPRDLDIQPLRAQLALSALVRRRLGPLLDGVDAVHVYTENAALLSADLLRRVPSVVSTDATNAQNAYRLPYRRPTRWTAKVLPLTQRFERRVYDAATLVVANSEWAASSLRDDYGVSSDRLRVFPFGIELGEEESVNKVSANGLPRVTFVGRTLERKGGRQLLDLHQRHLSDRCRLTLVTEEAVSPAPNVDIVRDIRAGDPRLREILAQSAVFAFPSEMDMAPNAVLEAMSAGVPVVALRVAALPEMIEDGVSGRLIEPGHPEELVAAIGALLSDPEGARRMGTEARRRVRERYDVRDAAAQLLDTLREAIALHRRSA